MMLPDTVTFVIVIIAIVLAAVLSAIVVLVVRCFRSAAFRAGLTTYCATALPYLGGRVTSVLLLGLFLVLMQVMGIVAWLTFFFVLVEGWRKYRATQQYGLLWLLTVSAERSMPLIPAIEAFARERGGSFGRRAKWLVEKLRAGVPLPDAFEQCPGLLPRYAMPAIRVGCETGSLAHALRRAAEVHNLDEPLWMGLQPQDRLPDAGAGVRGRVGDFRHAEDRPEIREDIPGFRHGAAGNDDGSDQGGAFHRRLLVLAVAAFPPWAVSVVLPARCVTSAGSTGTCREWGGSRGGWTPPKSSTPWPWSPAERRPLPDGIAALARSYPKAHVRWRLGQAADRHHARRRLVRKPLLARI